MPIGKTFFVIIVLLAMAGTNAFIVFASGDVFAISEPFNPEISLVVNGIQIHHSVIGLGIIFIGLIAFLISREAGLILLALGMGIFLQHLLFEDIFSGKIVLVEPF